MQQGGPAATGLEQGHPAAIPARRSAAATAAFDRMWADLAGIGRHPGTGGYRRYAWTREDADLREWFAGEAAARGLDLVDDRAGNLWAWWGDPRRATARASSSARTSTPCPTAAPSTGRSASCRRSPPSTPCAPAGSPRPGRSASRVFGDEEGARFGVACAGSRLITGALAPDRARALTDGDGVSMAEALRPRRARPGARSAATTRRCAGSATFVELHVEQGRALDQLDRAVAVGTGIWPHGRWRIELPGEANHAGTTRTRRPARPDDRLRLGRARRPRRGDLARRAGHLREGRRGAERGQRRPVAGHRLARRPRAPRRRRCAPSWRR